MTILSYRKTKRSRIYTPSECEILPYVMRDRLGLDVEMREYRIEDHPAIRTMYDDFEPKGLAMGLPPPDDGVRKRWVDDVVTAFYNFIALREQKIIGHAAIDVVRTKASLEYLIFLHQDFRGRGIGTEFSLTVKKICKKLGCRQVWVTVSSANTRAINMFKTVGFKFRGPIGVEREMELDLTRKARKKKCSRLRLET